MTPEQVAADIVGRFSWSSNVIEGGCLIGQQHAVARAIAIAIADERKRTMTARAALVDTALALNGILAGCLKPKGRVAKAAREKAASALQQTRV